MSEEGRTQGASGPAPHDEFGLIGRIRSLMPSPPPHVVLGPGDDAALVSMPPGELLAVSTDTLNEGVHFRREWMPPKTLGRRTVVQNVSDLAAMGARPLGLVVALSLEPETIPGFFDRFLHGLLSACGEFSCPLLGGNLARIGSGISVSATVFGAVRPGAQLLRSACRPGFGIWVSGAPGSAAAGLESLERKWPPEGIESLVARFLYPLPRTAEAAFLRDEAGVGCAIDLSDGVRRCASLVAQESGARIELDASLFPGTAALSKAAGLSGKPVSSFALDGGEDFELLFAGDDERIGAARRRFEALFGAPLTRIGRCLAGEGLSVLHDPGPSAFEHFK